MSEALVELARTDALLDVLASGKRTRTGDPVMDAMTGWVEEITSHPIRRVEMELPEFYARESGGRAWRITATALVVTAMSSSGIAAAATGDPLAPFSYVARTLGHLSPSADDRLYGFEVPAGVDPGARSPGSDRSANQTAGGLFGPYSDVSSHGSHRGPDSTSPEPRHRGDGQESAISPESGFGTDYAPQHLADGDTDAPPVSTPPTEVPPTDTPPVETPPEETPPVTTPPVETPTEPDPEPVPSDGPVVGQPSPPSGGVDSGSAGSDAADESTGSGDAGTVQVRIGEDAPTETPDPAPEAGE